VGAKKVAEKIYHKASLIIKALGIGLLVYLIIVLFNSEFYYFVALLIIIFWVIVLLLLVYAFKRFDVRFLKIAIAA